MSEVETKTFAFVVDGEVVGTISIPSIAPNSDRIWAGLSSNPTIVESTDNPEVQFGWAYDGQSFVAPAEV
jgi:hypothetical protein